MRQRDTWAEPEEFDVRVRDSFERNPGPAADDAKWLVIEEPALLASLSRQQALEHFWFGVQRSKSGQLLGMDVCLQRYAQRLDVTLWPIALTVLGQAGLDDWLRAQQRRHAPLLALPQGELWLSLEPGPLIERLVALGLLPNLQGPGGYPTGEDRAVFRAMRQLLSDELLRALPVDALPADLREQRLQIDLGV